MDNKDFQRALIAIVVSFLVLIGYQYFFVVNEQPVMAFNMSFLKLSIPSPVNIIFLFSLAAVFTTTLQYSSNFAKR